ncbi:uncharacterized protein LOC132743383 [Ruditapes philippinarum]|uniref:uncharacterized protein LOC132743383 n=1 Tax=Ruditapes philippinarum TaxID=129788 RepID=UPI00295BF66D|nr:uncharacterized protein LOC132743383 [Ruditapes philippinarum]
MTTHIDKGNDGNSVSDVVAIVFGFIGGITSGAIVWPVLMLLYGYVGGVLLGACVAGMSGVAIQDSLLQTDRNLRSLIPLTTFLFLPFLLPLILGPVNFEQEKL